MTVLTAETPVQPSMSLASWAQLLLLGAIWGGSFFFARVAVAEMHPLTLVLFRVAIAAAALQIYLARARPVLCPRPAARRQLLRARHSQQRHSVFADLRRPDRDGRRPRLRAQRHDAVLDNPHRQCASPADEKFSRNKVFGILLGIAGTAVMIGPGLLAGLGGPVWPKFALIGAALSYAFAVIFARRFKGVPPVLVATGQLTASTVIMIPLVLLWSGPAGLFAASLPVWAAVFALALVSTAFAYILYFRLVGEAGATNASLVTLVVPVSALLLGFLFLGERLERFEIAGMVLIALGLVTIDGRLFKRR